MSDTVTSAKRTLYPQLLAYLQKCESRSDSIPDVRKRDLESVASYISERVRDGQTSKLTFICTHNSRRSHLSQIWAHVAAAYYGVPLVETYSGGTEATAFNPRAVAAMRRTGLRIEADNLAALNPRYSVYMSDDSQPLVCFSKVFNEFPNPVENYCAVMTCSQADDACPLVMGCDLRVPIRYEDPKVADDTEYESQRYDERSAQICEEMLYLMSRVEDPNK